MNQLTRRGLIVAGSVAAGAAVTHAVDARGSGRHAQPHVAITWDGPWSTVFSRGLPLFRKHEMVSTVYAVTEWVGETKPTVSWDRYCTWGELEQLAEAGWEVSNHTRTHPHSMGRYTEAQARPEVLGAKQDLVARGFATPGFAYPYSSPGPGVRAVVEEQHAYARAGQQMGDAVGDITSTEQLYTLPTQIMPVVGPDKLVAHTQSVCYDRGMSLIWLCHLVGPPLRTLSIEPDPLERYLAWLAGEQSAGRLMVSTAWDLVRAALLQD